jgi:lipopolysaccharide cholinephosphotransferase
MLRPDFDRFMNIFNQANGRYKFICRELGNSFYYPYGKVLDTETVLYEPDENGMKISVNIDVFVYDNAPESNQKVAEMYKLEDWYTKLNAVQNGVVGTHGIIKDIVYNKQMPMTVKGIFEDFPERILFQKDC